MFYYVFIHSLHHSLTNQRRTRGIQLPVHRVRLCSRRLQTTIRRKHLTIASPLALVLWSSKQQKASKNPSTSSLQFILFYPLQSKTEFSLFAVQIPSYIIQLDIMKLNLALALSMAMGASAFTVQRYVYVLVFGVSRFATLRTEVIGNRE